MPTNCPIIGAQGECQTEGTGSSGVLLLGDFLNDEDAGLKPFNVMSRAGSVLERAIRRVGATRDMFTLYNVVPTRPPKNFIAKEIENEAIEWGRPYVEDIIKRCKPRAIVALGGTATKSTTGLCGKHLGVSYLCGYVLPHHNLGVPVIPCFNPSYLRQGHMSSLGVLMRCIRLALLVARERRQPCLPPHDTPPAGYITMPSEGEADEFARETEQHNSYIAYDIETMYSTDESEAEEHPDAIRSIQFSLRSGSGIYMPWRPPYLDYAKRILASKAAKLNWNGWRFDDPLIRDNGCTINGRIIDLMWAWHHSQPDLPRGLQFAMAMQGPNIYTPSHSWSWPWKHLDKQSPQFYGIVDVDVLQWLVSY